MIARSEEPLDPRKLSRFERSVVDELKSGCELTRLCATAGLRSLAEERCADLEPPFRSDQLMMPEHCIAESRLIAAGAVLPVLMLASYKLVVGAPAKDATMSSS